MSELALQLIKEAKENHSSYLDLGKTGLKELPKELFELTWLEELVLSDYYHEWDSNLEDVKWIESQNLGNSNHFIDFPSEIRNLRQLKKLIAGGISDRTWHIENINFLRDLQNLTHLYLSNNKIVDISPLSQLRNLRELSLSSNDIFDLKPLQELTNLCSLNLGQNQINNIEPLSNLKKLSQLNLVENLVSNTNPLENLVRLVHLYLAANEIKELYDFRELTNLSLLGLSSNKIQSIFFISELKNLKDLDLSNNLISDISPIASLMVLEKLNLNNNMIANIFYLIVPMSDTVPVLLNTQSWDVETGILVDENPIEYPPMQIVELGNDAIKQYFDEHPDAMAAKATLIDKKRESVSEKNWLNTSIKIGLLIGVLTGFSIKSFWVGVTASVVAVVIMLVFNPKRVFLNAAYFCLASAGYSAIPFFKGELKIKKEIGDGMVDLQLYLGEGTNLWATLVLIVLAAYLFKLYGDQNN